MRARNTAGAVLTFRSRPARRLVGVLGLGTAKTFAWCRFGLVRRHATIASGFDASEAVMLGGAQKILESINDGTLKTDLPPLSIGDTVAVHCRIVEGGKERVQVFQGVLISRSGRGVNEMITVRRIVDDLGVERTWPINSPMIAKIVVMRHGDARRSKLYYLRERVGKSRRLRDRRRGMKHVKGAIGFVAPVAAKPAEPAAAE